MLWNGFFFLALLSFLRWVFHKAFAPVGEAFTWRVFRMGFRYDARVVCIFLLIVLLIGLFSFFRPFEKKWSKRLLLGFTRFFCLLIILVYTFDFGHFAYLRQRLNASVLSYAEDAGISMDMMWQSYPVIKIVLGWVVAFLLLFFATRFLYRLSSAPPDNPTKRNRVITYLVAFLVFAIAIFGRVGQFPLRWSDAYRLNSDYKASLALNPFQSFVSSLKFRGAGFDIAKTKQYYPLIATELHVRNPDSNVLRYDRVNQVMDTVTNKPNIVLVICESFSAYKSSMWGNPLNTTPYFNELCKKGIFFRNCFTPAYGTARGVWATITGIPDVTERKTASRNPSLVDQHTIMNDVQGYEKFYFLGGSASWANIRGVLTGNIMGLHLYEQEDYSSPKVDVWGISDNNLFLEANKVLKQQDKPFFAIIQTANNHRPYTIPDEDRKQMNLRSVPADSLRRFGFDAEDPQAEMDAFLYTDYTFKTFITAAEKEKYFANTIFVFIGDHGIRGNAGDILPKVWTDRGLTTQHVPLLFYAPALLKPAVYDKKVSQLDVMPTIAALANMPVTNTTLGRNVFADTTTGSSFVIDPDTRTIGLVGDKYYYEYNLVSKKEAFYSVINNNPLAANEPADSIKSQMRNTTKAYYETARYMLFNNKKKKGK